MYIKLARRWEKLESPGFPYFDRGAIDCAAARSDRSRSRDIYYCRTALAFLHVRFQCMTDRIVMRWFSEGSDCCVAASIDDSTCRLMRTEIVPAKTLQPDRDISPAAPSGKIMQTVMKACHVIHHHFIFCFNLFSTGHDDHLFVSSTPVLLETN